MKNWKSTLLGALMAGLSYLTIYQTNGGDLSEWKLWLIPFGIATLGAVTKDEWVLPQKKSRLP